MSRISEQPLPITPWPIRSPLQPSESSSHAQPVVDLASISTASPAEVPPPAKTNRVRLIALASLGLVGLGVAGSLIPGPSGAAATTVPTVSTTVIRQTESKSQPNVARENAPVTISQPQEDSVALSLETADVGIVLPARSFGPTAQGVRIDTRTDCESRTVDGRQVSLNLTHSTLRGADGGELHASDDMDWARDAFNSDARQDWNLNSTMEPAGSYGRYVSVKLTQGGNTDGRYDGTETTLRTVDRNDGHVVTLDEVLGEADFEQVVGTVRNVLERNPNGGDYLKDDGQLRQRVATSFALSDEGGGTRLTVAIPPVSLGDGGTVARVEFHLPASAVH